MASELLIGFKELPHWLQDNPAIVTGYRRLQHSYGGCWQSLLYVHNETGNIYSHGLGAVAFILLAVGTYFYVFPYVQCASFALSGHR